MQRCLMSGGTCEATAYQLYGYETGGLCIALGNYHNRGELLLKHRHDGFDLDENYAKETLKNVRRIWNRPVWLATEEENKEVLLGYDGKEYTREEG